MKETILYLSILSILITACCSTRKILTPVIKQDSTTTVRPIRERDSTRIIQAFTDSIQFRKINYSTFAGKIDVEYQDGDGKKYDVNANIRLYKDSIIWVSVTGLLGIEGLRGYITKDSIRLLDKQSKTYTTHNISYLQNITGLPLTLSSMQDLLVGNPVFFTHQPKTYSTIPGFISLLHIDDFFKHLLTVSTNDYLLQSSKLDDVDTARNRTCVLTYSDYEAKKGKAFATGRTIVVTEKKQLAIKLHFRQYDFNEMLSFPFNVPKNYTRN